jgi:hypothetical protein
MENKTAIDWLLDKLPHSIETQFSKQIEQAKKMEKEQVIDFHIEVMKIGLINEGDRKWNDAYKPKIKEQAEQYYNETFNQPLNK